MAYDGSRSGIQRNMAHGHMLLHLGHQLPLGRCIYWSLLFPRNERCHIIPPICGPEFPASKRDLLR